MGTLYVRNEAQKVLFDEELKGQISDGLWENTRPADHWILWSDCEVVVRPESVGRDFHAIKDNYALTDQRLLECVGERMLDAVNGAGIDSPKVDGPYRHEDMVADLRDLKRIMRQWLDSSKADQTAPAVQDTGCSGLTAAPAASDESFDELRAALNDVTRLRAEVAAMTEAARSW